MFAAFRLLRFGLFGPLFVISGLWFFFIGYCFGYLPVFKFMVYGLYLTLLKKRKMKKLFPAAEVRLYAAIFI